MIAGQTDAYLSAETGNIRWQRHDWLCLALLAALPFVFFWRYFAFNPLDRLQYNAAPDFLGIWSLVNDGSTSTNQSLFLSVLLAIHCAIAAFGSFLLIRHLLRQRLSALLAAVVYCFSVCLVSSSSLPLVTAAAWIPLVFLCSELALRHPSPSNPWFAFCGLFLAFMLLDGQPQMSLTAFCLLIVYCLWQQRKWRTSVGPALAFSVATIIGLAACLLWPGLTTGFHGNTPRNMSLPDIAQLILPGSSSAGVRLYIGILPLLLAALAIGLNASKVVRFWGTAALAALLLALGSSTFLPSFFRRSTPGWPLFANAEHLAVLAIFALSICSGYGAEAVFSKGTQSEAARKLACLIGKYLSFMLWGLVLLLVLALLRDGWQAQSQYYRATDVAVFAAIISSLTWGLVVLKQRNLLPSPAWLALILVLFDLFTVGWR